MCGRERHLMRFVGAGLCVEQMLLRRCGIRGPLGTYDGAVARAESKTQGPFEWVFLEPIPVFVYDYVSKPVPVLRLLILDRCLRSPPLPLNDSCLEKRGRNTSSHVRS